MSKEEKRETKGEISRNEGWKSKKKHYQKSAFFRTCDEIHVPVAEFGWGLEDQLTVRFGKRMNDKIVILKTANAVVRTHSVSKVVDHQGIAVGRVCG